MEFCRNKVTTALMFYNNTGDNTGDDNDGALQQPGGRSDAVLHRHNTVLTGETCEKRAIVSLP
jgi:hypothetical protein